MLAAALVALRFTELELSDKFNTVRGFFGRRGAYRRFKDLLEAAGRLEKWYAFETQARQRALIEWCQINQIELIVDAESA